MLHKMNLFEEPFDMIKSGEKTIELRLYDEKRKAVNIDDEIEFTNTVTGEVLKCIVLKINIFESFEVLYENLPLNKCGYKTGERAEPRDMERYYTKEQQEKYGVVGIEIEKI